MEDADMSLEAVLELETSRVAHRPCADRDRDLLEALRLHDPTAAERLVATYGERAYRLATSITGNEQDAEEVVQDAFWTVVRKIETFRGESAFGSWLSDGAGPARRRGLVEFRDRGSLGAQRPRREGSLAPVPTVSPQTAGRGPDAVGCNDRHPMRLVSQRAEAGVGSMEEMLEARPATIGVAKGASSELPACRLRRVTQYVQENLQRELRLAELSRSEEHTSELQSRG